jgi:hypothetical protein
MHWLDPGTVPTLGDWFRAGGYRLLPRQVASATPTSRSRTAPGPARDDDGMVGAVAAYQARPLGPFGFSMRPKPHGIEIQLRHRAVKD